MQANKKGNEIEIQEEFQDLENDNEKDFNEDLNQRGDWDNNVANLDNDDDFCRLLYLSILIELSFS